MKNWLYKWLNPVVQTPYWDLVRKLAQDMKSDGCTMVIDIFVDCCYEHDVHFRYGRQIQLSTGKADGKMLSFDESNVCLKQCIQSRSWFKNYSPLALVRYKGVSSLFGKHIWDKHRSKDKNHANDE